jgi:hypothetical protein
MNGTWKSLSDMYTSLSVEGQSGVGSGIRGERQGKHHHVDFVMAIPACIGLRFTGGELVYLGTKQLCSLPLDPAALMVGSNLL